MITTPEIICDLFSFLDKDQSEKSQLVNQFWNSVIINHKNILPLRKFRYLYFNSRQIELYAAEEDWSKNFVSYIINFDGTNLSKLEGNKPFRYPKLTVDEVLNNLNDVVFDSIEINDLDLMNFLDYFSFLLDLMELVTTKTGGRIRGKFGKCYGGRFDSKFNEIFDNYIIVDELTLGDSYSFIINAYIRKICANPEIVQLPSTPKEIKLVHLECENEDVLNFTCNGKLNGANRLTIVVEAWDINYRNFIRQWFELYRTHQNPISLVGKFELRTPKYLVNSVLTALKTFLKNIQLRVKYSFEAKEFCSYSCRIQNYLTRRCVLHETDSYSLVIEMTYSEVTEISNINASDLDQPPRDKMATISFCVKSL